MLNRTLIIFSMLVVMVLLSVAGSNTTLGEGTQQQTPLLGDADCSGEVTIKDAFLVMRSAASLPMIGEDNVEAIECLSLGDVDCDTTLSMRDVMAILRFDVGKSPSSVRNNCVIGQSPPDLEQGKRVIAEKPLIVDGKRIGTLVRTVEVESNFRVGITATARSSYKSCYSEVYAKNTFGMKVFMLRHYQPFTYTGWSVDMYQPYKVASTLPGWSMHNAYTTRAYDLGWIGYSYSGATFKYMNLPWFGSLQSHSVVAGLYVYGNGYCYPWCSW